ncbi:hypothetical protein FA13DRAFT_369702 [Coprinellus micaceus]|uniref:Uncharacterized protein n=1 Tax=Coprinellus micaceus TaxID=71717 RepID=A0A4Y7TBY5_COPMI|nr:hypothetical protein FA13DRAFT_369702 [Coprinellus micaceus]
MRPRIASGESCGSAFGPTFSSPMSPLFVRRIALVLKPDSPSHSWKVFEDDSFHPGHWPSLFRHATLGSSFTFPMTGRARVTSRFCEKRTQDVLIGPSAYTCPVGDGVDCPSLQDEDTHPHSLLPWLRVTNGASIGTHSGQYYFHHSNRGVFQESPYVVVSGSGKYEIRSFKRILASISLSDSGDVGFTMNELVSDSPLRLGGHPGYTGSWPDVHLHPRQTIVGS